MSRTVRSSSLRARAGHIHLLREAAAIPIRPHTQRFALADANDALAQLKQGRIRGAAVLRLE